MRQNAAEGSDYACLDFGAFAGDDESFDFSGLRHRAWQPDYVDKPTVVPLYIIDQCSVKQDLDGPGRALGANGKPLLIVHHFIFHRSNLIFWIVMECGIADFGRRGL